MNNPEFQQVIDAINRATTVMNQTGAFSNRGGASSGVGVDAFAKDVEKKNQEKLADILPKLDKHLDHNIPTREYFDTALKDLSSRFTDTITTQFKILADKQSTAMEKQLKEQKRANELMEMRKIKQKIMPVSIMEFDKKALKQLAGLLKGVGTGRGGMGMGMMGAGVGGAAGAGGGGFLPWLLGGLGLAGLARTLRGKPGKGRPKGIDPDRVKEIEKQRKAQLDLTNKNAKLNARRLQLESELRKQTVLAEKAAADYEKQKKLTQAETVKTADAQAKADTARVEAEKARNRVHEIGDQLRATELAEEKRIADQETHRQNQQKKADDLKAVNDKRIHELEKKLQSAKNIPPAEKLKLQGEITTLQDQNKRLKASEAAYHNTMADERGKWDVERNAHADALENTRTNASKEAYDKGKVEGKAAAELEAKKAAQAAHEKKLNESKIEDKTTKTKIANTETNLKKVNNDLKETRSILDRLTDASQVANESRITRMAKFPWRGAQKGIDMVGRVPGVKAAGKALTFLTPAFWGMSSLNREGPSSHMNEKSGVGDYAVGIVKAWHEVITDPTRVSSNTLRPAWEDMAYNMATGGNYVDTDLNRWDWSENWTPGYSGSRGSKATGVFTGAGMGALEGAMIGGLIGGPAGAGIGAVAGGTIGAAAEIWKIYSDPILQQRKDMAAAAYKDHEEFFQGLYVGTEDEPGILKLTEQEVTGFSDSMKSWDKEQGQHTLGDKSNKTQKHLKSIFKKGWDREKIMKEWKSGGHLETREEQERWQTNMKDYFTAYGGYTEEGGWNDEYLLKNIDWYQAQEEDKRDDTLAAAGNTAVHVTFNKGRMKTGSKNLYDTIKSKSHFEAFGAKLPLSDGKISDIPPEHYRMFRELWANIGDMSKNAGMAHYGHIYQLFKHLGLSEALQSSEMGYLDSIDNKIKTDPAFSDQQGNMEKILHGRTKGFTLEDMIKDDSYMINDADGNPVKKVGGLRTDAWLMNYMDKQSKYEVSTTGMHGKVPAGGMGGPDGTGIASGFGQDDKGNIVGKFYDADAGYFAGFMRMLRNDPEYNEIIAQMAASGRTDNIPLWNVTQDKSGRSIAQLTMKADSPMAGYIAKRWSEADTEAGFKKSGAMGMEAYRLMNQGIKDIVSNTPWQWNAKETKAQWESRLRADGLGHASGQLSWEMMPYLRSGYAHLTDTLNMSKGDILSTFQIDRRSEHLLGSKTAQEATGTAYQVQTDPESFGSHVRTEESTTSHRLWSRNLVNQGSTQIAQGNFRESLLRPVGNNRPNNFLRGTPWGDAQSGNRGNALLLQSSLLNKDDTNALTLGPSGYFQPKKNWAVDTPEQLVYAWQRQQQREDPNQPGLMNFGNNWWDMDAVGQGQGEQGQQFMDFYGLNPGTINMIPSTAAASNRLRSSFNAFQNRTGVIPTGNTEDLSNFTWESFIQARKFKDEKLGPANQPLIYEGPTTPTGQLGSGHALKVYMVDIDADAANKIKTPPPILVPPPIPPVKPGDPDEIKKQRAEHLGKDADQE